MMLDRPAPLPCAAMQKTIAMLLALSLLVAACGSSDDNDDGADTTTSTAAESPDTTDAAPTTTTETDPPDTAAPTSAPLATGEAAPSPVAVIMSEWEVDAPATIAAGTVDFDVSNEGTFSHELSVARGDSYGTLPQLANGAVDEDTLGADYLGRSDTVDLGGTTTASFDLAPGNYVLFCNIQVGPNSHAAQGQTLSVTVVG